MWNSGFCKIIERIFYEVPCLPALRKVREYKNFVRDSKTY